MIYGNLLELKNQLIDRTTIYTYDADNNPTQIQFPDGKTNRMIYNDKGLVTEVINNDNTRMIIGRNNRGEITSITDEENRAVIIESLGTVCVFVVLLGHSTTSYHFVSLAEKITYLVPSFYHNNQGYMMQFYTPDVNFVKEISMPSEIF